MSQNQPRKIITANSGVFQELLKRIKLVLRLMGDRRVSPFLKLLPVAGLVYWLVPDLLPGPIDDAAIIWLSTYLFVELCPPDVVQEHMDYLNNVVAGVAKEVGDSTKEVVEGKIIEGEFREEK
jgi:hypothetical protein